MDFMYIQRNSEMYGLAGSSLLKGTVEQELGCVLRYGTNRKLSARASVAYLIKFLS